MEKKDGEKERERERGKRKEADVRSEGAFSFPAWCVSICLLLLIPIERTYVCVHARAHTHVCGPDKLTER